MRILLALITLWSSVAIAQDPATTGAADALLREQTYEEARLSTEARARREAIRLIRQVQESTQAALARARSEGADAATARRQVEEYLEEELLAVDEALAPDLRAAGVAALDRRSVRPSETLLDRMAEQSRQRQEVLRLGATVTGPIQKDNPTSGVSGGTGLNSSARGIRRYRTRAQLLRALVSGDESERWVATSNMGMRSTRLTGREESFSAQVAVEFMGSKIEAGPVFTFRRKVSTSVDVRGEGGYPLFDAQGFFDLVYRDENNRPVVRSGVTQSRFIFFTCDTEMEVESERVGRGGFRVAGMGPDAAVMSVWTNTVTLTSRRILVPDTVDGRQVTLADLARLCHNDFMGARTQNGRTVRENLQTTVRNLITGLVYRDSALECVQNQHCDRWYAGVLGIHRYRTAGRCVQGRGSASIFTCQLRGQVGANCTVIQNGERVSSGYFEYPCDRGLRCVVTRQGNRSFWNREPSVGECRR